jgi:hypothetical protein
VGESIRRVDMNPPALFAHSHPRFILVDHARFHQSRFELRFHTGQLLMARVDKGGNADCRELDFQQLLQQLAFQSFFIHRIQQVLWMPSPGRVSKREEKALSLSLLFVLIPLYKPGEKSLLYPLVKKLPTGLCVKRHYSQPLS